MAANLTFNPFRIVDYLFAYRRVPYGHLRLFKFIPGEFSKAGVPVNQARGRTKKASTGITDDP